MKHRTLLFPVFLLAMCAGCALFPSTDKYEATLNTWLGQPIESLVDSWGYPASSFTAPDGNKVYVYNASSSYTEPTTFYESTYNGQPAVRTAGGQTYNYSCITYFEVDSIGIIKKWRYQGNSCVSS